MAVINATQPRENLMPGSAGDGRPRVAWAADASWALVLLLLAALYGVTVAGSAWWSDEAFLTLRSAGQFAEGNGPVWNSGERVQAFSSPLWMALAAVTHALTHEVLLAVQALSIGLSLGAVVLLGAVLARHAAAGALAMLACLFSHAFLDFSTSGLENPVVHLALALFALVWFSRKPGGRTLALLGLTAGLGMLSRLDVAWLLAPCMACALIQARSWKGPIWLALGLLPLAAWLLFATLYYGAPMPTAYYIRGSVAAEPAIFWAQGFAWMISTLAKDPLTIAVVLAGLVLPLATRDWKALPLSLGIFVYCTVQVGTGGDYLLGRMLTAPFFAACILLARLNPDPRALAPAAAAIIMLGSAAQQPTLPPWQGNSSSPLPGASTGFEDRRGIMDERSLDRSDGHGRAGRTARWLLPGRAHNEIQHAGLSEGALGASMLVPLRDAGRAGFNAGLDTLVIDPFGRTDPFLARLPIIAGRQGPLVPARKAFPAGYLESLRSGENQLENVELRAFHGQWRLVMQGALFSPMRLRALWELNTGASRHLSHAHALHGHEAVRMEEAAEGETYFAHVEEGESP